MKKAILSLVLLSSMCLSVPAQDRFFNDSLRKHLKQHLVKKGIAGFPEAYDGGNLSIINLMSLESFSDNPEVSEYRYGIYSFHGLMSSRYDYILLRRDGDYEILEMNDMWNAEDRDLMKIMIELIAYFYRHPDVPKALFPLYVDAVSRVYYENSHLDKYEERSNDSAYFEIVER